MGSNRSHGAIRCWRLHVRVDVVVLGRVVVLATLRAVALNGACRRAVAYVCGAVVLAAAAPADHVLRVATTAVAAQGGRRCWAMARA